MTTGNSLEKGEHLAIYNVLIFLFWIYSLLVCVFIDQKEEAPLVMTTLQLAHIQKDKVIIAMTISLLNNEYNVFKEESISEKEKEQETRF